MKNLSIWVISAFAGFMFVLLLNTSPLSRLGLGVALPGGWKNAPAGTYHDSSCRPRHREGLPFAFKRQSTAHACLSDTHRLALALDASAGIIAGLLGVYIGERRWLPVKKTS